MEQVTFKFKVSEIEVKETFTYPAKPSKEEIMRDIKNWFFDYYYMWFSIEQNGVEANLEDFNE